VRAQHRPNHRASARIAPPTGPSTDAGQRLNDDREDMQKNLDETAAVRKARELERGNEQTPWIVIGDVWVVTAITVLAIVAVTVVTYFLAV